MENDCFWIGLNTPSSKNGKIFTGEIFIANKTVQFWRKFTQLQFNIQREAFHAAIKDLPKPLHIEFTFIRKGKWRFDYINMAQTIQDAMVYHEWIEDDDVTNLKPYFGDFSHDRHNAGCLIRIIKIKPIL